MTGNTCRTARRVTPQLRARAGGGIYEIERQRSKATRMGAHPAVAAVAPAGRDGEVAEALVQGVVKLGAAVARGSGSHTCDIATHKQP